jgi:hypothetical protein
MGWRRGRRRRGGSARRPAGPPAGQEAAAGEVELAMAKSLGELAAAVPRDSVAELFVEQHVSLHSSSSPTDLVADSPARPPGPSALVRRARQGGSRRPGS